MTKDICGFRQARIFWSVTYWPIYYNVKPVAFTRWMMMIDI